MRSDETSGIKFLEYFNPLSKFSVSYFDRNQVLVKSVKKRELLARKHTCLEQIKKNLRDFFFFKLLNEDSGHSLYSASFSQP